VETVAVAGLITLIVLFTMGLIPSFKLSNRRANMELQAGTLAQSILEQQRTRTFTDVVSGSLTPETHDSIEYTPELQVTDATSGKMKTVRVLVRWTWKDRNFSTFREARICDIPRA
jgi:hypothetical protein